VRGKLALQFQEVEHKPNTEGTWSSKVVERDPLASESHKLIEELKVYGNRGIAGILEKIKEEYGVPHISRVHPPQSEAVNKRLRTELSRLGVPWPKNQNLWDYLRDLNSRTDLTPEGREAAQILALRTRRPAEYDVQDGEGHEGLALEAGQYDHPSTPIRRFADMYNRALLEAYLSGGSPREVYEAVERDLALIVADRTASGAVESTIREAAGNLLEHVAPFDVFRGKGVPAEARSIAFRLRFRAQDRTLTDDEVDAIVERVLQHLREQHDVERRG